jgi:hypothetical protein
MKQTLLLALLAAAFVFVIPARADILSWYAPETWTTGEPIPWDEVANMTYLPCYSPYPTGPWTALPQTDLLWAEVPFPPAGVTWYFSCRVMYCPSFVCGTPSEYASPISYAEPYPTTEPSPAPGKGWGKGGKKK